MTICGDNKNKTKQNKKKRIKPERKGDCGSGNTQWKPPKEQDEEGSNKNPIAFQQQGHSASLGIREHSYHTSPKKNINQKNMYFKYQELKWTFLSAWKWVVGWLWLKKKGGEGVMGWVVWVGLKQYVWQKWSQLQRLQPYVAQWMLQKKKQGFCGKEGVNVAAPHNMCKAKMICYSKPSKKINKQKKIPF